MLNRLIVRSGMKKQPEITDKTRQVFVDTFCELYKAMPVEKISIKVITDKAGYNRATFYRYFCDIYELLDYVETDVLQFARREYEQHKGKGRSVVAAAVKLFDEKGDYLEALLGDYGSNRFMVRLKKEISWEESVWAPDGEDRFAPYLLEFRFSTILPLIHLWQCRGRDLSAEELFSFTNKLFTGAMKEVLENGEN